jgi:hypothetical protein
MNNPHTPQGAPIELPHLGSSSFTIPGACGRLEFDVFDRAEVKAYGRECYEAGLRARAAQGEPAGQALRMAVERHMTCRFYFGSTVAQATVPGGPAVYETVDNHADPLAGACQAIAQAAAKIDAGIPATASTAPAAGSEPVAAWLFEHDGTIAEMPVGSPAWAYIKPPGLTFGKPEVDWTHDASKALRFTRREDAEAFRAGYLGLYPRDWDKKAYRVTEHMWVDALAAPAPAATAEAVAESATAWKSRVLLEACSKWSGNQKVEAGDIIEWLADFPIRAALPSTLKDAEPLTEGRPEWDGVQDEVALTRAVHVMNDVLGDISGWEDRALADAVKDSKIDLMAMIECIRMSADDSYVPGSKLIDGETFGAAPAADKGETR